MPDTLMEILSKEMIYVLFSRLEIAEVVRIQTNSYNVNKQKHTLRYNYNNVLIRKLLHVSAHTGPSSGSAQLHKTIV
jgi:hypothetical protein